MDNWLDVLPLFFENVYPYTDYSKINLDWLLDYCKSVIEEIGRIESTIPSGYDNTPDMDGVGTPGESSQFARGDHVHPSDTSRAVATSVAASASINDAGLITFKNSDNTSLFTLQLPLYNGGVI